MGRFGWLAVGLSALLQVGCTTLGAAASLPDLVRSATTRGPVSPADPPGTLAAPRELRGAPRIAVALGGGSLRGYSHIGVIAALERADIRPSLVVGTSAGSVVGALWAAGLSAAEIDRATSELDWKVLANLTLPHRGLLGGDGVDAFVRRHVKGLPIEALPVAFAAIATDARTGQAVTLNRGDTAYAVRASSSIPVYLEPVTLGGRLLVDGGLSAPTPVRLARELGADLVIAVNVAWSPEEATLANPLDMLFQTMQVMGHNLNREELAHADVVIAPDIRRLGPIGPGSRVALVALGEEAGNEAGPAIREAISRWQSTRELPSKTSSTVPVGP